MTEFPTGSVTSKSAKLSLFAALDDALRLPVANLGAGVELVQLVPSGIGETRGPIPLVGGANCGTAPVPWFSRIVSVLSPWLTTARSCAPELRKSAVSIATGFFPTVN